MYGESGGLLDVLEHPSLRLMKPLPKRRRTVSPPGTATQVHTSSRLQSARASIVQVEAVAAQLPHPSHDLLQHSLDPGPTQAIVNYVLNTGNIISVDAAGNAGGTDDVLDYGDHLHARGNKKKRKVPAALAGHISGGRGDDPEGREDVVESDLVGLAAPGSPEVSGNSSATTFSPAQLRLSPAARAGLRRKAMVHERKQLLAAVLEREENLDPIAVEHALATSSPFMVLEEQPRVRSSRRIISRIARITKDKSIATPKVSESGTVTVPSGPFEYRCTSVCECLFHAIAFTG
jgi:hypothetical protein